MKKYYKVLGVVSAVTLTFSLIGVHVAQAATAPDLGAAESFSVLAALSMSAAGAGTTVDGDLGLSPGLEASRTGPWTVGGSEYFGTGGLSADAQDDALDAFNDLAGQISDGLWASNSMGPGVWTIAADTTFSDTLTLTGDADDIFVFQIGNDMTFDGDVIMVGGADPCNVYWQIGRDATITADSQFKGTLIASRDISLVSGADVIGRMISLNSSLTTDGNTITGCATPAATISVVKVVVNDDSGAGSAVADFSLFVDGTPVTSGIPNGFAPGTYTITETGASGYTQTFSGDCNVNGSVILGASENAVCILTNNDIAASQGGGGSFTPPIPPLIEVVKVPSPLALPGGPGPVTYTYTVRNIGTVPMTNITMVGDTCSPIVLISGDTNTNATLEVSETWTYTCSTTLTETHTNTITATGWANGISSVDIATATVIVGGPVPPLIHVTKIPNPLVLPARGGAVTYTERITNPGTVALSNVTLVDDRCSPLTYISGDADGDSLLDTTETWTYTCRTNLVRTTTNTAVATGQANGETARDFAIATVVVGAVLPGLPSAGLAPTESIPAWSVVALGILVLASTPLLVVLRKRLSIGAR
jgi:uncharacterized repeat protein (TIGR01451 family)